MMSGRCSECNSQIVWGPDGEVCCSKCGLVVETIRFEKVSDDMKSIFYKPGLREWLGWKTAKEKRRERRERGPKDFTRILNELRTSEELSANLRERLLSPSKKLLLDTNDHEVESLCKVDGKLCHLVITSTQNRLIDDFRDRFKFLHETGWIHSRTMEDAAFVALHCLLFEQLDKSIKVAIETSNREVFLNGISNELIEALLEPAFIGALIDSIEERYPERKKLLYERDLPYFIRREAHEIEKELLKKHPELKFEFIPYFPRRIDPALLNVRKGDLWQLFRMPYYKGKKPIEMLKRVEKEVRIKAWLRFRNFLSNLSADQLKNCKKTGLNAACCYVETYIRESQAWGRLLPFSDYFLRKGYKSKMLVLPVSQEKWAKAFDITRQTLINRMKELQEHDPYIIEHVVFVREMLA